jgi:CRP-like cAMP-binding protein
MTTGNVRCSISLTRVNSRRGQPSYYFSKDDCQGARAMIVDSPECQHTRKRLRECNIFDCCDEKQVSTLLYASYCQKLARARPVYRQGDFARDVYVLLEGGVKLCSEGGDERPKVLQLVEPMELFGIFDVLSGGKHDVSAVTLSPSDVLVIDADAFVTMLNQNAPFAVRILSGCGHRFREFSTWCFRFNHYGAREKVAAYLIKDSRKARNSTLRKVNPTRRDIASLLGITPETLSRELSYFRKQGWVRVEQDGALLVDDGNSLQSLLPTN